jgi:hypothetical protein
MPVNPVISMTTSSGPAWAGPTCPDCRIPYTGVHECAIEDLMEQAERLKAKAMKRFDELCPQPTIGPEEFRAHRIKFDPPLRIEVSEDRMAGCPCRPENGGSGVCGCTLGGPEVTC